MQEIEVRLKANTKEVSDLISQLGKTYQKEMECVLLDVFHRLINDSLTTSDINDIGERYGINVEASYISKFLTELEDDEIED